MRRLRTIAMAAAVALVLVAVQRPATASADLGDLLGLLSGGSPSQPGEPPSSPTPPPSSSSPNPLPTPATPTGNPIPRESELLATESDCPGQTDLGLPAAARAKTMVCMLSYARVAKGRAELHVYKPLHTSATDKAHDIRRCRAFTHEACGRDAFYWVERVGFFDHPALAGEILAFGASQAGSVLSTMRAWLGSPTHRAVILHSGFDLVGVATLHGRINGSTGAIWVAHLGYRRRG
jgi:uncharacterized protein YkwD